MTNEQQQAIYSLGISGRLTLDLHSLNNEGGEGNQIATRTVNVVYQPEAAGGRVPAPRLAAVNAISGDMFKHIQAEHLFHTAVARGLALCRGCREFNSNRILADPGFKSRFTKATPDRDVLEMVLQTCTLDDLEGVLVTENNKSLPRKSLVEFGWVVGVPELVQTEQYFHAKYVSDSGNLQRSESSGANLGQNIFHRPASSGVYAVVASVELSRIGYNDISRRYAQGIDRQARFEGLMESLLHTFVQPNGAMRNTQHPHVAGFEGVLSFTTRPAPAPVISGLNPKYREDITRIRGALNRIHGEGAISVEPFESMGEFAERMSDLQQRSAPFAVAEPV